MLDMGRFIHRRGAGQRTLLVVVSWELRRALVVSRWTAPLSRSGSAGFGEAVNKPRGEPHERRSWLVPPRKLVCIHPQVRPD